MATHQVRGSLVRLSAKHMRRLRLPLPAAWLAVLMLLPCVPSTSGQPPAPAAAKTPSFAFVRILGNDQCNIDDKWPFPFPCEHLVNHLRSMHVLSGPNVMLVVDEAPYETVASTLDSLSANGYTDVFVAPPAAGTNPSSLVTHWIRFLIIGDINHPFPIITISTDRFRTWNRGEFLIVLPQDEYDVVRSFTDERFDRSDCLTDEGQMNRSEHTVRLVEHEGNVTRACLLPRAAVSCDFLAAITDLSPVKWTAADLKYVRNFAGEIGCVAKTG
jgi:hypothetical protein